MFPPAKQKQSIDTRKENKMNRNREKTILRDSGNGQFISKQQAAGKPQNTWQKERVSVRNPKCRFQTKDVGH
jgi:hypothetical protein